MHWVLSWDRGGLRGYDAADEADAQAQFARKAAYPAEVQVSVQADGSASLTFMVSRKRVTLMDVRRIAQALIDEGITNAYCEREEGRGMPYGTPVTQGPMAGCLHLDLRAIVAGSDGDY